MGILGTATSIKDQIERGVEDFLRHWYDQAPAMPHIFPIGVDASHSIVYYVDAADGTKSVRVRIANAGTFSLYKFTPEIRTEAAGGGNYMFYDLWDQYGF